MKILYRLLALSAAWLPVFAHAQSVGTTTALAPLAGPHYTPASGQSKIGFYGTDLGYAVKHNGSLRVLFGDTWADANRVIGWGADDAQGTLSLAAFPNGTAVDAYVAAHPAGAGKPSWHAAAPPLSFRTNLFGTTAATQVLRNGVPLDMGAFRAPTGAFSNAIDGMFGIFDRNVFVECSGGASPSCSDGLTCDTGIGTCFPFGGENNLPCRIGTTSCWCVPVAGGGMCQDRSSPLYNTSDAGRVASLAQRIEVANASLLIDEVYYSKSWITHKLINSTVRTVNDFDPARTHGAGNDYRPADGALPTANEKVFLWGRPAFAGANAAGMSAKLYFAYADMPRYSLTAQFSWAPRYFAGTNANGTPRFSALQTEAVPLELSAPGNDSTREQLDIVNQLSVSWVPALNKWVMLYGGDLPDEVTALFVGSNTHLAVRNPHGAVHARFASQPWGPWSAPVEVLAGGDAAVSPPLAGTQYAPNGILFHPACATSNCVASDPNRASEPGRLYGASIIDAWTTPRAGGAVDLYWNVSTWNPYQVVLMRTRLTPPI